MAAAGAAKRFGPFWGALIVALPLTSMLAMAFVWFDTKNAQLVNELARDIFILVPVSLLFFVPFLAARLTDLGFAANFTAGILLLCGGIILLHRLFPNL
ncbi:MAG: hypothetical protein AUK36_08890 [Zetaproteobacteria bacterium CG2_30_59_37]|nr:MAG: hypothetical protein AUK36_08890 [Zetaproteobacteria bacterium CG2_30_59_37]